jgi:hypothetical protein
MKRPKVPAGLRRWDKRIGNVLHQPFPPPNEPKWSPSPNVSISEFPAWLLVCEEVLDTVPPAGVLTAYYEELLRRGLTGDEISDMRHFAWLTAGWLNFEKMLWEWVQLDRLDVDLAIDLQLEEGLIDEGTAQAMHEYAREMDRPGDKAAADALERYTQ